MLGCSLFSIMHAHAVSEDGFTLSTSRWPPTGWGPPLAQGGQLRQVELETTLKSCVSRFFLSLAAAGGLSTLAVFVWLLGATDQPGIPAGIGLAQGLPFALESSDHCLYGMRVHPTLQCPWATLNMLAC
jgi:hypothetical protein